MPRIYIVETTVSGAPVKYLIRANTAAQAERHVAAKFISGCTVAGQNDLVALISAGKTVENAVTQEVQP